MFHKLHRLLGGARATRRAPVYRARQARRLRFENLERRELMTASPAAPTFSASAASPTQIVLAWNSVPGATGYQVDELKNNTWTDIANLSSATLDLAVAGLAANTTYDFDVAATNSAGASWAGYRSVTTPSGAPLAPSVTATAASGAQINLSWASVSGASGYYVDEYTSGGWKEIASYSSGTTSTAVTGLSAGTTYSFDVGATNSYGTTWANVAQATTLAAPQAPASLSAAGMSGSQLKLSWNASAGATSYTVDEFIGGTWQQIDSVASGTTSVTVSGLNSGTNYDFEVEATNTSGASWSPIVSTTTSSSTTALSNPTAATAYVAASGSLFSTSGPLYTNVQQGNEGDCWLMASFAEVAARDPQAIRNMFTADGTATENGQTVSLYTVRFYTSAGVADSITIDNKLPSGGGYYAGVSGGVLWVALAEKAYAEASAAGIVTTSAPGSDSYNALDGGDPWWALQAITGKPANDYAINPSNLTAAWNAGDLIVLDSSPSAGDNMIVGDSSGTHSYAMVGYSLTGSGIAGRISSPFELYNPWGDTQTLNGTVTYNGHAVYGGTFYTSAPQISADFSDQAIVATAEPGGVNITLQSGFAAGLPATSGNAAWSTPAASALTTTPAQASASSGSPAATAPDAEFQSHWLATDELLAQWSDHELPAEFAEPLAI